MIFFVGRYLRWEFIALLLKHPLVDKPEDIAQRRASSEEKKRKALKCNQ